jgi:hypothetical protein
METEMFIADGGDVRCNQIVSSDGQREARTVSCQHIALTSSLRKILPLYNWKYQYFPFGFIVAFFGYL